MNKAQLVDRIAVDYYKGNRAEATRVLNSVLDTITAQLAWMPDDKVTVTGFGIFERVRVPARVNRNPKTGAKKTKPEHIRIKVTPGRDLEAAADGVVSPRVTGRIKAARARAARP